MAMVRALIAGERDPRTILADLAKGPLRGKRAELTEALDGLFDSHHGVITQMLLGQVAFLDRADHADGGPADRARWRRGRRSPGAWTPTGKPARRPGPAPDSPVLAAACTGSAEIPGVSPVAGRA